MTAFAEQDVFHPGGLPEDNPTVPPTPVDKVDSKEAIDAGPATQKQLDDIFKAVEKGLEDEAISAEYLGTNPDGINVYSESPVRVHKFTGEALAKASKFKDEQFEQVSAIELAHVPTYAEQHITPELSETTAEPENVWMSIKHVRDGYPLETTIRIVRCIDIETNRSTTKVQFGTFPVLTEGSVVFGEGRRQAQAAYDYMDVRQELTSAEAEKVLGLVRALLGLSPSEPDTATA